MSATYRPKERTDVNRSKVPVHAHGWHRPVELRVVAQSAEPQDPAPKLAPVRSHGPRLQLRQRVQEPRPGSREEGPHGADDRLAGLVAGGLRPLRTFVHSHGM